MALNRVQKIQCIEKQNAKEIACKEMGYNYLLIINNNFDNLKNIKEIYGK
jgi:hypothetical protein